MCTSTQRSVTRFPDQEVPVFQLPDHGCRRWLAPPVEGDGVARRLPRRQAHVRVGVTVDVGQRLGLAPEGPAEPAVLHRGEVLDQPDEVGAPGSHRPAQLLLVESLELHSTVSR